MKKNTAFIREFVYIGIESRDVGVVDDTHTYYIITCSLAKFEMGVWCC